MRKALIIIALIIFLLPDRVKENIVDLFNEDLEASAYAGLFVYLPVNSNPDPSPKPDPNEGCKCNKSTGKISYDGGTSLTDCPCKNGDGKCGCKHSVGTETPQVAKYPRVVLITNIKSCLPCRNFEKDVINRLTDESHKKSGWVVSSTREANVQVLDLSDADSAKEIKDLGLTFSSIPTFYFLNKDGSKKSALGYMSYDQFIAFAQNSKKK